MKPIHRDIARRLKELRQSQCADNASAMARALGLTPQAWYNYEIGRRALPVDVAARVIDLCGVDWNWLFTGHQGRLPSRLRSGRKI